jgi:hypothetical protein
MRWVWIAVLAGGCGFVPGTGSPPPLEEEWDPSSVNPNPEPVTPEVYADCTAAYEAGKTQSGVYLIDDSGVDDPFAAYCDMTTSGGRWMLAIRADGSLPTFGHDAPLWLDDSTLNPDTPGWTDPLVEGKLATFSRIPIDEILVIVPVPGSNPVRIELSESRTLLEHFADPESVDVGVQSWTELVGMSSIPDCEISEGLGVGDSDHRARIGLVASDRSQSGGNNYDDVVDEGGGGGGGSCDSTRVAAIGVGLAAGNSSCTATVGSNDETDGGGCAETTTAFVLVR